MNLSLEVLIIVAQICLSANSSPEATAQSVKCNREIIRCTGETVNKQFIRDQVGALNKCIIKYELEK